MNSDVLTVAVWWATLLLIGVVGWPLVSVVFDKWQNKGYLLAKAGGLLLISFVVWIMGSLRIMEFGLASIGVAMLIVGVVGVYVKRKLAAEKWQFNWRSWAGEELFFLGALIFWSWVKAHEPSLSGLEKFMDFGFTRSILRGGYFPPADMWFSGEPINYYYFGHLMMAVISKISNVSLEWGFNLMLASLFGMCLTMSYGIGRELLSKLDGRSKVLGAALIAFLVTASGNLHTIYAFTKGYLGEDNPPPFWQIWSPLKKNKLTEGMNSYWYPNATRFIPYTIHEFPAYSFVVSDIHGHVLSIPIVLALLALTIQYFIKEKKVKMWQAGVYGAIAGMAFMTNALDGLIYIALFALMQIMQEIRNHSKSWFLPILIAGMTFVVVTLPFTLNFKPFVNGVAVNCPPASMAESKYGPIIFETVDKCQKSPVWMMLVLWGFFLFNGIGLWMVAEKDTEHKKQLLTWSAFAFGLIVFAEFFYFKDIYPQHFRSNTMFKLGYQAFIIMSIVSGYTISQIIGQKTRSFWSRLWLVVLVPLIFLISIYPYFAVRSYFGGLKNYQGIWGLGFLEQKYPDDLRAIKWLNINVDGQRVILEAAGDSYTDYERISTFTGLPTVAGWAVHEWLWRGSYDPIAKRAGEVQSIYESSDFELTRMLLGKYKVSYVIVGELEREKYPDLNESKLANLGKIVFASGNTRIYEVF